MLPDFPKHKRRMREVFELWADAARTGGSPLLSMVRMSILYEGDAMEIQQKDGTSEQVEFQEASSEMSLPTADLKDMRYGQLLQSAEAIGEDIAGQQARAMFQEIAEATEEVGSSLDARGQPFHPDLLIQLLDKMQVDFDHRGNPRMPAMFVNPRLWESIKDRLQEWDEDEELKSRLDEVVARKKEEWRAREARRRLVD